MAPLPDFLVESMWLAMHLNRHSYLIYVVPQGSIIDRIDYNMEKTAEQTAAGKEELTKAERSHRRSPAMSVFFFFPFVFFGAWVCRAHSRAGGALGAHDTMRAHSKSLQITRYITSSWLCSCMHQGLSKGQGTCAMYARAIDLKQGSRKTHVSCGRVSMRQFVAGV